MYLEIQYIIQQPLPPPNSLVHDMLVTASNERDGEY